MPPKKSIQKVSNKIASKGPKKSVGNKNNNKDNTSKPKKTKEQKEKDRIPDFVPVPENDNEDDIVISDDDLEFFADNKTFTSFLTGLDQNELSRNTAKKDKKQKAKKVAPKKEEKDNDNEGLASSEEEFNSDDDLDNFEEMSDDDLALLEEAGESEDDIDLNDDEEMEQLLAQQQQAPQNQNKKKLVKVDNESDEEMDYEMKPRKVASEWTRKDYHTKLPIKLASGKIHQLDEDQDSEDEEEEVPTATPAPAVEEEQEEEEEVEEQPKLSKKEYLIKKKEELALIAGNLQGDPEEYVSQLKTLRTIYRDDNVTVKKLSLLTQLAVYKDIIPGYRIRPLTTIEEEAQVSREVKKMREYEKALLSNYEMYLKDLNVLLTKKKTEEDASLAFVATRCLCELLIAKTHFNFRLEIMVAVVTRMSTIKWNESAQLCSEALVTIFENDESGRSSLDAVKMIIRMVKSKGFAISENAINVFLHLRLKDEMAHNYAKDNNDDQVGKKRKNNSKPFLTKKARKTLKETREIEKEFQEAEAVVSKEEKEKNHTETLKLIFTFYFRILKKQTSSPLLPAVLEGLSRFAHLISVDFFDDLLNALKDVMHSFEDSNDISRTSSGTRKRLLCIITAFQLLSGQGEAFNYDLKDFYTEIYNILFKASYHTKIEDKPESQKETESEMLIKGLELMFLKKRQIPVNRLAAFTKRFTLVALNMPNKTVLQCLALVDRLVQKDHRLDALLQSEDRASSGIYAPLLEDPELCNPFGTSLYELFLYQNHYDPNVRTIAKALQKSAQ
ncbi:nucleolar complex-associated protein 3 [Mucor ambiguus]|uniref:Nucleolar complex-associated protein 3 n=1 Tax=Mucor ambiguus TaxID=91626 RepID=A0A0C9N3E9_9FUNG|nr:nucleolar complex-associated protein 3 [Mucor ambiguus]